MASHALRPRFVLVPIGIAMAIAVAALGCPSSDATLPDGVVPAQGGGYCCPVTTVGILPCGGNAPGGWKQTPEQCAKGGQDFDCYPVLVGVDDHGHGCPTLYCGGCGCNSTTPCPATDASVDADADAGDGQDARDADAGDAQGAPDADAGETRDAPDAE